MAAKYKVRDSEMLRTIIAPIATDTVIEAGDLVTVSSGLIIKAVAASTTLAFSPKAHVANSGTEIEVTVGNDFTLTGTMDVNFAAAYRGVEYDINDTTQTIDQGASVTKVLKVSIGADAGTVGTATGVNVRINKPCF
ncbi:MAG: hypothetical protein COZ25_07395 [Ignavibacteria bacterium CG_4_10_14_3_um_filter_37_18]|nr:MAG: hypothetical protein COZ25_07395 [Ignavibacteria bacterium CG_4_10_14_3_um_filter_37_18]